MARKRFWIGSLGPYFYDDDVLVNDPQGVVNEYQAGMVSEGTISVLEAPTEDNNVTRLKEQKATVAKFMAVTYHGI